MEQNKFNRYMQQALSTVYSEEETPEFHTPLIGESIKLFIHRMQLTEDSLIYDVGCGQAVFMEKMRTLGFNNICGVTLSKEDFVACQEKGFNAIYSDFSDMPAQNESVDMIWCRHALEHSPAPVFTLMEFNRILKEEGWLYVEVPAPNLERLHEDNPNHYSVLGDRMWLNLFYRTGFAIAEYRRMDMTVEDSEHKTISEQFYCFLLKKNQKLPCNQ